MIFLEVMRRRALHLELLFVRGSSFIRRVPLLRFLYHGVTASVAILSRDQDAVTAFSVEFRTPYLNLPLELDRTQIGSTDGGHGFQPAAFRFFDWHSWTHIAGEILWHGEREVVVGGRRLALVTGFEYRANTLAADAGNLGLRVVEGVEGMVRVFLGDELVAMKFEPVYWMLERRGGRYNVVPIKDDALMGLIVSLSEIGSGNEDLYRQAVEHLWEWLVFRYGTECPERSMLEFLRFVRKWGAIGMEPLFRGLKEVLDRLRIANKERILYEFYADNWGVGDNRQGRILAVKTLEALGTERAYSALAAILAHAENQSLPPGELNIIRGAVDSVAAILPD